ncbi:MAG: pyridoxamine 5'-phosphate oxidase family protein [Burkholderiaceae bacterium]|nr:pyridoxamine 5'-phosphate oxidase family protein [Burkholderiaceae bacterium]
MDAEADRALRQLLRHTTVAALATLHQGEPAVSMVPYALLPDGRFVIHVSRLATHTQDMLAHTQVSLLVTAPVDVADTPLALPRVSVQGLASVCPPEAADHAAARAAYLARRPEAEELFGFGDFSLFLITPLSLRYVAGFGRAYAVTAGQYAALLRETG